MKRDPVAVRAEARVQEVATRMVEEDVDAVVVIGDGRIHGVVTDWDVVVRVVAAGRASSASAADACRSECVTVEASEPVQTAVALMCEHAVDHLPVVEHGRLVGIVSTVDLDVESRPRPRSLRTA